MLKLYGSKLSTIGECRVDRFGVVARKSSALNLALLPPTSGATYQHSLRTLLQVQLWLGKIFNPENYGWKKTETMFLPVQTEDPLAPAELLTMVHCSCVTSNCSKNCGCKKAGLRCTRACKHCRGETCLNSTDIVVRNTNEDDNDNEILKDNELEEETNYVIKPGYLEIMKSIYGSYSDDSSDDDMNEDDDAGDLPHEVCEELPSQSLTSVEEPVQKRQRKK
ncbi:hypothetical protein EVAR_93861_1 [Eumeta japonica]|uniref:Tesmin/TSO1-like CXC domain-containing protein n=1 Tax=Eumeta variegata TaxID=151549 RepID=A0A4C1TXW8_EUMVA|nr:hypothetical protein EVAR_93861_1 [Eumeta japonica]